MKALRLPCRFNFAVRLLKLSVCLSLMFCIVGPPSALAQTIELQARTCSASNVADHNSSVLLRALKSGSEVLLPEGEFQVSSFMISGVTKASLRGTVDTETNEPISKLVFSESQGIRLSHTSDVELIGLDICGPADGSLITLEDSGEFSAENLRILAQTSSSVTCLSFNLDWLVPVLHILL
jgi:hypothetical protein